MMPFESTDNPVEEGAEPVVNSQQDDPLGEADPVFQNLYSLSDEEKEDILKQQNERLVESAKWMAPLQTQMIKSYKKYRSIAEPLKDDLGREITNRANIFVPYPHAIIEAAMPRLAGRLPRVHAFPRKRIEQEKVEMIQDLILYALDRMSFLKIQQQWIRQFEIYGWSPLVFFWKHEERKVFSREKDDFSNQYKMVKKSKTVWDDFGGRVIDVFDAFIQPGVEQIDDTSDWFMYREWMSKKDIKARVEGEIFYKDVLDYIKDNPGSGGQMQGRADDSRTERDNLTGLLKNFQKHSFGRYEVIYTLENDRIIINIDGKILARVGDNPNPLQEKPVINLNLLPMVNEPIGISTIESLGGLPDKLNVLESSRLDNISLTLNKVCIADRNTNTDFDNIIMGAGNVILTDNIETSLKFLDVPDLSQSSEREVLTTKEEMQFVSGVSDYIVGVKSGARLSDTATGVSSIIRESNAKFALKLAAFESYALRKLVEVIHTYNMMYMPDEKRIHVLGPNGYLVRDIKLEDILMECDFLIEPGSSAPLDQLARREALMQLLDRVLQMPQVVDINKYMKEVMEAFDIRNPEDMLIQGHKKLPEAEDAALAEAENVALLQGQEIELKGDPRLHLNIHDRGMKDAKTPEQKVAFMQHISLHYQQQQAILQQSAPQPGQNQLFGGNPNASPTATQGNHPQPPNSPFGGTPSGAGGNPPLAGANGVG